jgi:two-component system, NtrC family, sensor kinase
MKTLGEAAMDLPWIAPSVDSLTTLARSPLSVAWIHLRGDPGFVLLSASLSQNTSSDIDTAILDAVLAHQPHFDRGGVDWNQAGPDAVRLACSQQALLASQLAEKIGCDARNAWIAGFLAPLGWLAVTAAGPDKVAGYLKYLKQNTDVAAWQRQAWGIDHTALARRLSRGWRLPAWLTAIISHLGLHASIAERLGAEPRLFQVVQVAIALVQERRGGLGLPIGTELPDLLAALTLDANDAETLADAVQQTELPAQSWESPAKHPLVADLLRLSLENRRHDDTVLIERLQLELDRMQETLVQHSTDERNRLQAMKLSSLAEFAAGAGHEINNPLAVISGQAQYVLKQLDWLDVPAEEIENVAAYLENLRTKITPSLQKIIGQTQRIHTILTDLMQFARPSPARRQSLSAGGLIHEVTEALAALAKQRSVRLVTQEIDSDDAVSADAAQARLVLMSLLRNAVEAAPADGWAGIRVERADDHTLNFFVEDNGQGPPAAIREHLFDPFFSGRSAGRGRGLGLPIAWRLARQQGGEVRFDGINQGVTRFVLTLPLAETPVFTQGLGYHLETSERNGVHPPLAS